MIFIFWGGWGGRRGQKHIRSFSGEKSACVCAFVCVRYKEEKKRLRLQHKYPKYVCVWCVCVLKALFRGVYLLVCEASFISISSKCRASQHQRGLL